MTAGHSSEEDVKIVQKTEGVTSTVMDGLHVYLIGAAQTNHLARYGKDVWPNTLCNCSYQPTTEIYLYYAKWQLCKSLGKLD